MKEKQEDEAVLGVTLDCDIPVQLVVPHLDGLSQDVQGDGWKHLTYGEAKAESDVDAYLVDPPDVHHDALPDVVKDVLLRLSKMICWMLCNVCLYSLLLTLDISSLHFEMLS